ncbi:MAG: CCA tRNA nucleotidyltransferase [Candidatus Izimaplasma sp.]|nr:CCA tRNA nucleotidyltransferase [Candidatus Izimaplasma bacterium]
MNRHFEKAKEVLRQLEGAGYAAYFVGGYVRDRLLEINSGDIDITTNATPEEVITLFDNVKETGKKYGSVTVIDGKFKYEVTTFRSDGIYTDNRHPENVEYSNNILDDLARRDFTINAIIMDSNELISDYYESKKDLDNKLIRTINDPLKRFSEDSLRMLRAFRFVSKLGFDIEEKTLEAITELKYLIKNISIERVMVELDKTFRGPYRNKALKYMIDSEVDQELYGLSKGLSYVSNVSQELAPIEVYIICYILDDIEDVWRFSNKNKRLIEQITNLHEVTKEDIFNKFIVYVNGLQACLLTNKINIVLGYNNQETLIRELDKALPIKDVCDLTFKGQDILWLTSLKKKSWIGIIVDDLKYNVIMGTLPNDYEVLKEYALKKVEELILEMGDTDE